MHTAPLPCPSLQIRTQLGISHIHLHIHCSALRCVHTDSEEVETVQGCFKATDWEVLCAPHGDGINAMTDCKTDYINFCIDNIIPIRRVQWFPSNAP